MPDLVQTESAASKLGIHVLTREACDMHFDQDMQTHASMQGEEEEEGEGEEEEEGQPTKPYAALVVSVLTCASTDALLIRNGVEAVLFAQGLCPMSTLQQRVCHHTSRQ